MLSSALSNVPQCQCSATYTPTAMDYDFALITLSQPASSSAGFLGMTVGTGSVTLNLTSAGYPVQCQTLHLSISNAQLFSANGKACLQACPWTAQR